MVQQIRQEGLLDGVLGMLLTAVVLPHALKALSATSAVILYDMASWFAVARRTVIKHFEILALTQFLENWFPALSKEQRDACLASWMGLNSLL